MYQKVNELLTLFCIDDDETRLGKIYADLENSRAWYQFCYSIGKAFYSLSQFTADKIFDRSLGKTEIFPFDEWFF